MYVWPCTLLPWLTSSLDGMIKQVQLSKIASSSSLWTDESWNNRIAASLVSKPPPHCNVSRPMIQSFKQQHGKPPSYNRNPSFSSQVQGYSRPSTEQSARLSQTSRKSGMTGTGVKSKPVKVVDALRVGAKTLHYR